MKARAHSDIEPCLEFKDNEVGRKTGTERSQQETTVRAIGQGLSTNSAVAEWHVAVAF